MKLENALSLLCLARSRAPAPLSHRISGAILPRTKLEPCCAREDLSGLKPSCGSRTYEVWCSAFTTSGEKHHEKPEAQALYGTRRSRLTVSPYDIASAVWPVAAIGSYRTSTRVSFWRRRLNFLPHFPRSESGHPD